MIVMEPDVWIECHREPDELMKKGFYFIVNKVTELLKQNNGKLLVIQTYRDEETNELVFEYKM